MEKEVISQRYRVEKATPYGYQIVDTAGVESPYVIQHFVDTEEVKREPDYLLDPMWDVNFKLVGDQIVHVLDPRYMSQAEIERAEEHDAKVAQDWCIVWNLVESGYCGSCKKKFAEGEARYVAVGYDVNYRTFCFPCACSRED